MVLAAFVAATFTLATFATLGALAAVVVLLVDVVAANTLATGAVIMLEAPGVGVVVQTRRVPWKSLGCFVVFVAPWVVFATFYFGSPLPASIIAKLTVYQHTSSTPGSFTNTISFNHEAFRNQFTLGWVQKFVTLLFCIGALRIAFDALRAFRSATSDAKQSQTAASSSLGFIALFAPIVWVLLYYGTMLTSRVPAFPWYFLPPWPVVIMASAVGGDMMVCAMGRIAGSYLKRSRSGDQTRNHTTMSSVLAAAALVTFIAFGLVHVSSITQDIARMQFTEDHLRRPLGIWLRDHVAPNERVLLEPIGYAGYYSGRRILDMVGLVSPEVLPYYRTPHALSGIVSGLRPEWLCLRLSERDLLVSQDKQLLRADYVFAQSFPSPNDPAFLLYHIRK